MRGDGDTEPWDDEPVDGSKRGRTSGEDAPGAYVGHEPERGTETSRVASGRTTSGWRAVATQTGAEPDDETTGWAPPPEGHRQAER